MQFTLPWNGRTGHGFSFGIDEGGWSGNFLTGVRVKVPLLGDHLGLVLRPNFVSSNTGPNNVGGRIDIIGQSDVYLNLIRLYGGGGVELYALVGGGSKVHSVSVSGGGQFGFEFFLSRYSSFYIEIGGHGAVDATLPGGLTVVTGMNFYPWT